MEKRIDKATERALEAYPKETRDITGFVIDIGHPQYMRDLYIEGYNQAEKDNELTWEDMREIYCITLNLREYLGASVFGEPLYQEVLKRFNKERKEK
jgi:hypothetical protein